MSLSKDDREPVDSREGEAFSSRWSRRKQVSDMRQDQTIVADPEEAPATAPPPLGDSDMPPIESLDEESDFRDFLSPEVSDELRRLALRKLFHAPTFNIRDGLDDYDEDLTQFAKLGGLITADIRHQLERVSNPEVGQAGDSGEPDTDQPQADSLAAESGKIGDKTYASADEPASGEPGAGDPEQSKSEQVGS